MKKPILIFFALVILTGGAIGIFKFFNKEKSNSASQAGQLAEPVENKNSNESLMAIDYVVNKKRPLASEYEPSDLKEFADGIKLRNELLEPLNNLLLEAKKEGISYYVLSGYRSYENQQKIYNEEVKNSDQATADALVARPGHSEHQTGLALDLGTTECDLEQCFGDTKGGIWLAQHAHEYGFIIRYQKGWETRTGYQYEPWHLRYVGNELAGLLTNNQQTMEEYFNLPPAPSY